MSTLDMFLGAPMEPDLQIEKAWLPPEEAARWWDLFRALPWAQRTIRISGRFVLVPRKEVVLADEGISYGYSGQRLVPSPWGELTELRDRASEFVGHRFNLCLLNQYLDENSSVDWHSDDEEELGADPVVASLSFGEARLFEVRAAEGQSQIYRFTLGPGDLAVMPAGFQRKWKHRVPKSRLRGLRPRVSMTFRNIVR
jgi:alkylated DNA repair dioxygenase AlkB